MDWLAAASLTTAAAALLKVFWPSKSHNASHSVSEVVDDSVLGRFEELFDRIGILEIDLAEAKRDLAMALVEIRELRKLEEYLQARLHEKDAEVRSLRANKFRNEEQIKALRADLKAAQDRIAQLERSAQG